jgi:ligand-binding SRPBCC domain-containing protein
MKSYHLSQNQFIKADLDTVWSFFSSPRNLNKITPSDMNFDIIDIGGSEQMFKGQTIKYSVCPFPFLRLNWVSEIVDVVPKKSFVDTQKKGPFKMWHHQHSFYQVGSGVEMSDHVTYSVGFGFLGRVISKWIIQKRVNYIFEFRKKQIESIFPIH